MIQAFSFFLWHEKKKNIFQRLSEMWAEEIWLWKSGTKDEEGRRLSKNENHVSGSNWPSLQFSTSAWGACRSWFNIRLCFPAVWLRKRLCVKRKLTEKKIERERGGGICLTTENTRMSLLSKSDSWQRIKVTPKNNQCFTKHYKSSLGCG